MFEVASACNYHGYPESVSRLDHLFVLDRSSRLDDGGYAICSRLLYAILFREECVACKARSPRTVTGLFAGYLYGVDPGHLSGAYTDSLGP